jgi:hypothetical protein
VGGHQEAITGLPLIGLATAALARLIGHRTDVLSANGSGGNHNKRKYIALSTT